jgi:putative DNA primase/helicase
MAEQENNLYSFLPLEDFKVILFATDEYRGEIDVIGNFIKEKCDPKKEMIITIKKLYKAYSDWCEENNEHLVSERFFTLRLKEMRFEQSRNSTERFWVVGMRKRKKAV